MNEIFNLLLTYACTVFLAVFLGKYMAKVYRGKPVWTDFMKGLEKIFFQISGIDPQKNLDWKENMQVLLLINFQFLLLTLAVLLSQDYHGFLNPDQNPAMSLDLALNTSISFLVNCNLQHYSGEVALSYLSQMMLMFLQFVTAATGMAAAVLVFNSMQEKQTEQIGNFYRYFVLSCTRILLPISVLVAIILLFNGTPMTFEGKATITTLEGTPQTVARGVTAAMVAIKQLGTNGGGYFAVNSAHPLENPTYWTNTAEVMSIFLIPIAMIFALGEYLQRKKLALMIFGVMSFGYVCLQIPALYYEMNGNPVLERMRLNQDRGSMEGKEIRIGSAASAYWAINTTVTSNGSVNAMHDSLMPLSGAMAMLGMMVNAFYGGVGVGFLNFYLYIIVAVFIAGLMVGRTPEFLGRKIEASEIKIAILITLLHPFLILVGTAVASYLIVQNPEYAWLNNSGFHGFSEMLFEYTSSAANNGSGFEGLGDNTPFWNFSTTIVLALGRYLPIIAPVAIAGRLASKKFIPTGVGTLPTDNLAFGVMIFAVIFIVAALSFFPALVLGAFAEHFTIY